MLLSGLVQLLQPTQPTTHHIHTIPVLEKSEEVQPARGGDGAEENTTPFRLTPHTIRVDKDEEFFEVCLFTG